MTVEQPLPANRRWLSIVGIGEDGLAGLGDEAKQRIADASVVFGGKRHLQHAGSLVRGEARPWPSPFDVSAVLQLRGQTVCVLASGDPFLFGVGATLARAIDAGEMHVIPAPSAFSLAAARLGWPLSEIETVSLHGRRLDLLRPLLHPGRKVLALTSDAAGPAAVARLLTETGFGPSRMHVLEALGGANERVRTTSATAFDLDDIDALNVVGIEVSAGTGARILPLASGLPHALFEHDGQITKREIRAVTLAALAPRRGERLLDIGAGSGSVSIEWMLADVSLSAVAVEASRERAARIRANANACGVPGLTVVEGAAPGVLTGLMPFDAVFVGGGLSDAGVPEAAMALLRSGGRLVANTVTLESEAILLRLHSSLGGELTRISVARAEPVGGMTGWRPSMPVMQWNWVKP
ncbi:MAG: precorrin-6y C5,15-methyltransferase (decarboxylating) subunit CbiE [Geminicoccaceae bacterium]